MSYLSDHFQSFRLEGLGVRNMMASYYSAHRNAGGVVAGVVLLMEGR